MPKGTCSAEGCERPIHQKALCGPHYERQRVRVRRVIECGGCGETREHAGHGLCQSCNDRRRRAVKLAANPDAEREYQRAHIAARRQYTAKWRRLNADRQRAATKRWREENRERYNAIARRRKDRRLEPVVRLAVLEMYDGLCGICGLDVDPARYEVDHILPFEHGGWDCYGNVQLAHPECNGSKADSIPLEAPIDGGAACSTHRISDRIAA